MSAFNVELFLFVDTTAAAAAAEVATLQVEQPRGHISFTLKYHAHENKLKVLIQLVS
jgi:hypothetical protein